MKLLFLFLILLSSYSSVRAQQKPTPPASVLQEARRVGQYLGFEINDAPGLVSTSISKEGHTLWEMDWENTGAYPDRRVCFTVDQEDNIIVKYYSITRNQIITEQKELGQPETITEQQAIANAQNFIQHVLPTQTNLQFAAKRFSNSELSREWWVIIRPYSLGAPVLTNSIHVYVEPYSGTITSYSCSKGAVLVPPVSGLLISIEQAEQLAQPHFLGYTSSVRLPTDSTTPTEREGPTWAKLGDGMLCRLRYRFAYHLDAIKNSSSDPDSDLPYQGRSTQEIWVEIDAETGDLWSVSNVFGGGGPSGIPVLNVSAKIGMLLRLDQQPMPTPLQIAIASGKVIQAISPSKKAIRFTQKIPITLASGKTNERSFSFALNPEANCLTFEYSPGKWSGVRLDTEHVQSVSTWIKKINTKN